VTPPADPGRLDVLLATYRTAKDEIARRSALQWAILGGYTFLLYNAFIAILKHDVSKVEIAAWSAATWAGSAMALLFHRREQLEIMRLSHIISDCIDGELQRVALGGFLFERFGLGSDKDARQVSYKKRRANLWERAFNISLFLLGPLGLTIVGFVVAAIPYFLGFIITAVSIGLASALVIGYLLGR
jgi:hypothetical protein